MGDARSSNRARVELERTSQNSAFAEGEPQHSPVVLAYRLLLASIEGDDDRYQSILAAALDPPFETGSSQSNESTSCWTLDVISALVFLAASMRIAAESALGKEYVQQLLDAACLSLFEAEDDLEQRRRGHGPAARSCSINRNPKGTDNYT